MCAAVPEKKPLQHLKPARDFLKPDQTAWHSGVSEVDKLLAEAMRPGNIIEWGTPQGKNGRLIPLLFLRAHHVPAVWIYGDPEIKVYAPAWASYGVDLRHLFFIHSKQPVKQLRPLFMDNSFRMIVLDDAHKLSRGALAFISSQARHNGQLIFILRNYFLSQKTGTALASMRVNCWQNNRGRHVVHVIKGRHIKKIELDLSTVVHHELP